MCDDGAFEVGEQEAVSVEEHRQCFVGGGVYPVIVCSVEGLEVVWCGDCVGECGGFE